MSDLNRTEIHKVFDPFFYPQFVKTYLYLKKKSPNSMLLIITDHMVHDDFFWELNSFLIDVNRNLLPDTIKTQPIIPLPFNSSNEEFINLMAKMGKGTMLIDAPTFFTLTFKNKDPFYFYSDRVVIHRTGEVSFYAGRRF